MELEFKSEQELYERVLPALKSKKAELKKKGYKNITEENMWHFLATEIFTKMIDLTLADVVSYIMHIDEERLAQYIDENNLITV